MKHYIVETIKNGEYRRRVILAKSAIEAREEVEEFICHPEVVVNVWEDQRK